MIKYVASFFLIILLVGCGTTTKYFKVNTTETNYRLPDIPFGMVEIHINDFRVGADDDLRAILLQQISNLLPKKIPHEPHTEYKLQIDILEHNVSHTPPSNYWIAITTFQIKLLSPSGQLINSWEAKGRKQEFNLWGYSTAKIAIQKSYDAAVAYMLYSLYSVSLPNYSPTAEILSTQTAIPSVKSSKKNDSKQLFTNRWAVVIGISRYGHKRQNGLTNLIFADDDAKAFTHTLQNLGWSDSHIKLLLNEEATERNIKIALEAWLTKAGPNDQIVLFWAGHGFPDPEDPEKVYFACYDTDIRIPATGYRMDKVRTALEERKSKNVIVLADTCHAGKIITRGNRGVSIVPNIEKMRREKNIPKGWIFMVGADTDRQAIEDTSWANGAFTHSLIKGLSGKADGFQSAGAKDGIVTMGELRSYMNTAMPDETLKVLGVAKRPVIMTSSGDPDIWNLTLQTK